MLRCSPHFAKLHLSIISTFALASAFTFAFIIAFVCDCPRLSADPCGMVPPIYTGTVPIKRKGNQETYVFFKDGIETFVIRPGYEGKIDDFGMLIPFPTPPSVRKVPDNIFEQLANAVDPPEVVIDLSPVQENAPAGGGAGGANRRLFFSKSAREVRVIREEAVGMYEVAVLEAGSAAALKKWMDARGYVYPKGMDKVTNEYVDQGWCFVAVKTKIGDKSKANPKPGQRKINSKLPDGASFDGSVQGMGFRFVTKELVVPMRLSAFNAGSLRNIVYLLTDSPKRIRNIPEEFVRRQISGKQLYDNVTKLLPLRVIGGELKDIPKWRAKNLDKARDPRPKNGVAKELFAMDLMSASTKELSMKHEETEKELLRISEHLGMRDEIFDKLHDKVLSDKKSKLVEKTLASLKNMTLTVVDGDFSRAVIAQDNIKFANYRMPSRLNNASRYDAKITGPQKNRRLGKLYLGSIDFNKPLRKNGKVQIASVNSIESSISSVVDSETESVQKTGASRVVLMVVTILGAVLISVSLLFSRRETS